MISEDLKKIIMNLPDDYEIWVNDDYEPDELSIDFTNGYITFVVKELLGNDQNK